MQAQPKTKVRDEKIKKLEAKITSAKSRLDKRREDEQLNAMKEAFEDISEALDIFMPDDCKEQVRDHLLSLKQKGK